MSDDGSLNGNGRSVPRWPVTLIAVVLFVVVIVAFSVFSNVLGQRNTRRIEELFAREQILQTVTLRNSLEASIARLFSEASILASYSFREFEQDLRTRQSMADLFEVELEAYREVAAYSYRDLSGDKSIHAVVPGETGKRGLEYVEYWERSYEPRFTDPTATMTVPPVVASATHAFLGFLFPVTVNDEAAGILTVAVDLAKMMERYSSHLMEAPSGQLLVFDTSLRLLWAAEEEKWGSPIGSVFPTLAAASLARFKTIVETNPEGFTFLWKEAADPGHDAEPVLAWSTVTAGGQEFVVGLLSDERPLNALLQDQQRQRNALIAVFIGFIVFSVVVGSHVYVLRMEQRIVHQHRNLLERRVDEKTRDVRNLLTRYTSLFNHANDAILVVSEGVIDDCNAYAMSLFQADRETLVGSPVASLGLPIDAPTDTRGGNGVPRLVTHHGRALDGREFDAEVSTNSFELDGKLLTQVIVRDVSRRYQALREKEAALSEVHHRVKNNLQIIDSLLVMQSDSTSNQVEHMALRRVRRRIHSMSSLLELLYEQESLRYVDAATFLARAVGFFGTSMVPSMNRLAEAEGTVRLIPQQCNALGIIVIELVDNALTHGGADVGIELWAEDRYAVVQIRDGGTKDWTHEGVAKTKSPGLGLAIARSLADQIRGTLVWTFDAGTVATLRFPLVDGPWVH